MYQELGQPLMGTLGDMEVAVLTLMLVPGLGRKTLSRVLTICEESGDDISSVPRRAADELGTRYKLRSQLCAQIKNWQAAAVDLHGKLMTAGVAIVFRGQSRYPTSLVRALGEDAPPVLFCRGAIDLLAARGVAIVGSRKASDSGLRIAADIATAAANEHLNVVSGGAAGIDQASHIAALAAGGTTTVVLAEGILVSRLSSELAGACSPSNSLVISDVHPMSRWSPGNAMQRNLTVLGLSGAVVVIESGTSGGTHAAAAEAHARRLPLFVVEYGSPPLSAEGNAAFIKQGAVPVRANAGGKPNCAAILLAARGIPKLHSGTHELEPHGGSLFG